ncbi:MAG: hypothetical protein R6U57_09190 [Anaerolineales bacterium]
MAKLVSETEFQLRKLITKYSDLFVYHQWPSEQERWVELVFALISRISPKPEIEIRDIITELDTLGLLDIEDLASIPSTDGTLDVKDPLARRIIETLSENRFSWQGDKISGLSEEEAKRSLLAMHEAASSLVNHHGGKIQKYLRRYGQQMLDDLQDHFSFTALDKDDLEYAFGYWLQNVLNMPIILRSKSVDTFCDELDITDKELIQSVDALDINLALVDDFIEQYITDFKIIPGEDE